MVHPIHDKYTPNDLRRFRAAAEGNRGRPPSDWYDLVRMLDDAGIEFTFPQPRFYVKFRSDYSAEVYDSHEFETDRRPIATFRDSPVGDAKYTAERVAEMLNERDRVVFR